MITTIKTAATNGISNPISTVIGGSPLLFMVAYQQFAAANPELQLPWHSWFWYVGLALAILGWVCPDWRQRLKIDTTPDSYITKAEHQADTENVQ